MTSKIIPTVPPPPGPISPLGLKIWEPFYRAAKAAGPLDKLDLIRLSILCDYSVHFHMNKNAFEAIGGTREYQNMTEAKERLVEGLSAFGMPLSLAEIETDFN